MRFLRTFAVLLGLGAVCAGNDLADRLFKAAQRAERAGDSLHAYLLYARAASLDPLNLQYVAKKAALQATAEMSSKGRLDPDPAGPASGIIDAEPLTGRDVLEAREARPPPHLKPSLEPKSFDLKGDARTIFEKVMEAYGLLVVFESDYQTPPPFRFHVDGMGFNDTLHALEAVSNSFLVPVNERLALVVRDTPQKRTEMAPTMAIAIPIPERISVQEATEIIAAVQQTLEIRRISVDPGRRIVYLRDQVSKATAARQMFANLSRARAQIEVDVEFISIEKNSSLNYGLSLPNSSALVDFGTKLQTAPFIPSGFTSFLTFGGGGTFIGLGITAANAMGTITRSSINNLLNAQVTTLDGQAATLHVGSRYPVITSGYYGTTNGVGTNFSPPPNINFEDLGLSLKVTPSVHAESEVSLTIEAQFRVLGTTSSNGIPVISSRQFHGTVRMKDGEWAVIAGLVSITDSDVRTGIAGIADIPWIGRLLSQNSRDKVSTDVLLLLKPHLVNLPPWEFPSKPIWIGTETKPVTVF